jgi:hypothetical protein
MTGFRYRYRILLVKPGLGNAITITHGSSSRGSAAGDSGSSTAPGGRRSLINADSEQAFCGKAISLYPYGPSESDLII